MTYRKLVINENTKIVTALKQLGKTGEKNLVVINKKKKLVGVLSDGDLRRAILKKININNSIKKIYNKKPLFFYKDKIKYNEIKKILISKKLFFAPIVDKEKNIIDLITWDYIFGKKNRNDHIKTKIPVIVMAGGKGTRLLPFTDILPKPLIPINGKSVLEHVFDKFSNYGLENFFLSINYKSKIIKAFFEELKPKYKISFLEEKKPLGTAGSLGNFKLKIKKNFFVTNSDIILDLDYSDLVNFHKINKNIATCVVATKDFIIPYGTCNINSSGKLLQLKEKPTYNFLVNSALYLFNKSILKYIKKNEKLDMNDLITILMKKNLKIMVYPVSEKSWIDVGQWNEYKKAVEKRA